MPSTTKYAQLWLYSNTETDKQTLFSDFRDNIAGPGATSNFNKIDTLLSKFNDDITALKDATGIITVHATATGGGSNYEATDVAGFSEYKNDMLLLISVSENNAGLAMININGKGNKSMMKINSAGTAVNLDANDLKKNTEYLFRYDGTKLILTGEKFESVVTSDTAPTNQVVGGIWNQILTDGRVKPQVKLADGSYGYIPPQTQASAVLFVDGTSVEAFKATLSSDDGTIKWSTPININGMTVDGNENRVNYGICSTDADTTEKSVDCEGFGLVTGAEITVKFTSNNTKDNPTLNVNNTGAKAVMYRGTAIPAGHLAANRTYTFRYDGTNYDLVGDIDTDIDTKYDVMTGATDSVAGKAGLAPAPEAGANTKFLRGDATYQTIDADSIGALKTSGGTISTNNGTTTFDGKTIEIERDSESLVIGEVELKDGMSGVGLSSMGDLNLVTTGSVVLMDGATDDPIAIKNVKTPTENNDAVNKTYVDSNYLPKVGGQMRGALTLTRRVDDTNTSNSIGFDTVKGLILAHATVSPSVVGDSTTPILQLGLSNFTNPVVIRGVATPTSENDVANKAYVDNKLGDGFLPLAGGTVTGNIIREDSTYGNLTFGKITGMASADGIGISSSATENNRGLVLRGNVITVQTGADGGAATIANVKTPTADSHAANKQYTDTKVSKTGSTMTGHLELSPATSAPESSYALRLANNSETLIVQSSVAEVYGGAMALTLRTPTTSDIFIYGVKTPTLSRHAANKAYVDNKAPSKRGSVTIPTSSWAEWTDTNNNSLYRVKITVAGVTANHRVDFYMDYGAELALPAPIKPMNDNGNVYAVTSTVPTTSVTIQYDMTLTEAL